MKKLEVGINKLTSLVDAPADYVRHVVELEIHTNPMEDVSSEFLGKFVNLKRLLIGSGRMTMRPNMFESLKELKVLFLVCNDLTLEYLNGLTKLEEFHLIMLDQLTTFDYMGLMNALPALKKLEIREHNFDCDFLKKMMKDLKAANRFDVVTDNYKEFERDGERGFRLFGERCSFGINEGIN